MRTIRNHVSHFAAALLTAACIAPHARAGDSPTDGGAPLTAARQVQASVRDVAQRRLDSIVAIRARRPAADSNDGANSRVAINGAGTVIDANGLILTNEHVVAGATEMVVTLHNGRRYSATLVGADHRGDVAILKVDAADLAPLEFCDWADTAQGDWVVAVGNPLGTGGDGRLGVSIGVIENLDRRLPGLGEDDERFYDEMIQFSAPIHPGNSGGPLLNLDGRVVGIVTAMHVRAAADAPISFAIPLTPARRAAIARLCRGKSVEYGYIGLRVETPESTNQPGAGVIVTAVDRDGPARHAGVAVGTRLIRCDGTTIDTPSQFAALIGRQPVGSTLKLELQDGAGVRAVSLAVERRPQDRATQLRTNRNTEVAAH